jgi:hypothetical protein
MNDSRNHQSSNDDLRRELAQGVANVLEVALQIGLFLVKERDAKIWRELVDLHDQGLSDFEMTVRFAPAFSLVCFATSPDVPAVELFRIEDRFFLH